jgi:hypothetical protein
LELQRIKNDLATRFIVADPVGQGPHKDIAIRLFRTEPLKTSQKND